MRKLFAAFLLAATAAVSPSPASAQSVTMAWSEVGNPGNAPDLTNVERYGTVNYSYNIGTYDVTVNQYVAFLNSNDPTGEDPLGLYNTNMSANDSVVYNSRGTDGSLYSALAGEGNNPIIAVTFYDTLRFANWLDNGQKSGMTETGAYTLSGGTPTPSNGNSITRNSEAIVFLPNANEWYKAAYYNPATHSYYLYPTSSSAQPTFSVPTAAPNSANYNYAVAGNLTPVGAYSGTTSPYGAYDMGGDVYQWNQAVTQTGYRGLAGGSFESGSDILASPAFPGALLRRSKTTASDSAWQAYSLPNPPRSS